MQSLIIFACFLFTKPTLAKNAQIKFDSGNETYVLSTEKATTSKTPPRPCPPEKSLHTKEDIKIMIDHMAKTLSIHDTINNSYYFKAMAVSDKHMNDFNQFRIWYQNRPEHLKHNVDDLGFLRIHIDSLVKNIANTLEEYPQLQENFDEKVNTTNRLFEKLNRYKIICENSCEIKNLISISSRSDFNGYYCSSLKDLHDYIESKLNEFAKNMSLTMVKRVDQDDHKLATKFETLKNKLKDDALKKLGRTMHDVLILQDEYHHFIENLMKADVNSQVYNIKQTNLLIETKLLVLEKHIETYGKYCRACSFRVLRSVFRRSINSHISSQNKELSKKNLLDRLINHKYVEMQSIIDEEYSNIFKQLDSVLDNTDTKDVYLTDLKPIQDDIIEMLNKQKSNFNELKNMAPSITISKLSKLNIDSKKILLKINTEIDNLRNGQINGRF